MERERIVFVAICDLAAHVRGKGFPEAELQGRLLKGVGFTHSNIMMSAFGPIFETPFGTEGDLMLVPDPTTKVDVTFGDEAPELFYLGDLRTTDNKPWECCPRHFLRRALADLEQEAGLRLLASFEQEFVYTGVEERPGDSYALSLVRRQGIFGEALLAALRKAGLVPDSFLPEYGPRQFEVTVAPAVGLRAADEAVILREMARSVAERLGHRATFAPILEPAGIGNGTHIHFSLLTKENEPAAYDPAGPYGLTPIAQSFVAGILYHLPALAALTAPSVTSYYRLKPDRWAPTWTNLGLQDRGASLRICPIFRSAAEPAARQFNVEYRVADATASPYMALGAIVHAGLYGIRKKLSLPPPFTNFWAMSDTQRLAAGVRRLPQSLGEALEALKTTREAQSWLGEKFFDVYLRFKMAEMRAVEGLAPAEICQKYAAAY
jgi:glutamine synthetase